MITILGANNLFPHIYHKYQVYAANDYFHHKTSDHPFPTLYEYLESTYAKVGVRTEKQIFMRKHPPRYIILIQISRILGYNFACKD
ncbi:hypothetical protein AALE46_17855, partial [Tannerellaceae bacterium 33-180]